MAIPIEGFTVVARKARIEHLLEDDAIEIPNVTALGDDDIWRCCFMAEADARAFMQSLEKLDLNVSQGPDSDVVLVNEFDRSVDPYCEWLVTARWDKAVIAWMAGTRPESIVAREGWDPKVGSRLSFRPSYSLDNLEFLRLENNVEVFLNRETGEEVYIGRTSTPVQALFATAAKAISKHLVTAGEKPVTGKDAETVAGAVEMLDKVIAEAPDFWKAHLCHGKGQIALGNHELAYQSLRRAYDLEKGIESIPRELAGVCLQLGKFDEAVGVAEQAVTLEPDDAGLIGNLALAYLLAGRIAEAKKSIAAAIEIDRSDKINEYLGQLITEVADGKRSQPNSMADLS